MKAWHQKLYYLIGIMFLVACGDFNKPIGNGYYWLGTNASNHVVYYEEADKTMDQKIIVDSNVIELAVTQHYIIVYREKSDMYDRSGEPPPGYGYFVIEIRTRNKHGPFGEDSVREFLEAKGLKMPKLKKAGIFRKRKPVRN